MPHRAQPVAFLAGGEGDVGLCPFAWPRILVAIEARRSHPVLQSEIVGILDTEPALFGRIDEKQAAERPERLTAKILFAFLVEHDDALARIGDLGRCDQSSQPRADDDDISLHV